MLQRKANIHDVFFKRIMGEAGLAETFLREHLPREIASLLAADAPEPVQGSFVDESLAQHHSDSLFRLRLNTGDDTLAYVLLEHKSSSDQAAPLQVLRYVVRILAKWHTDHKRLPLPLVLPLLVHQGPKGWQYSTEFMDLFGSVPELLRPYLPSFRHALVDLAHIDDDSLSADRRLCSYLKTMKYIQRPELPHRLSALLIPGLPAVDIKTILHYIGNGPVAVSAQAIETALQHTLGHRPQEEIMGFIQEFEARGEARGLAKGEATGLAKGEAQVLIRLLEKRFGLVPASVREHIFASDITSIEAWVDRVLDAQDLESIFA